MSGLDGLGWPNPEDEPKPKTMNDTPETDDCIKETKHIKFLEEDHWTPNGYITYTAPIINLCRKLERERDEAREERKNDWEKMHNLLNQADKRRQRARNKRDEARGQRDKLAAVLQRIRDGYGGQAATPNCCEDCDFLIPIDEALATSNQLNL
jgi:hypothetical protein